MYNFNKRIDADLENRRRFALAVFKAGHPLGVSYYESDPVSEDKISSRPSHLFISEIQVSAT